MHQAAFFDGAFHGRADVLVRTGTDDAGAARYAVVDAKLARRAKVPALLQLAAYADQLVGAGVPVDPEVSLVLGTRERTSHRLADLLPVYRDRRERLVRLTAEHVAREGRARGTTRRSARAGAAPTAVPRWRRAGTCSSWAACTSRSARPCTRRGSSRSTSSPPRPTRRRSRRG